MCSDCSSNWSTSAWASTQLSIRPRRSLPGTPHWGAIFRLCGARTPRPPVRRRRSPGGVPVHPGLGRRLRVDGGHLGGDGTLLGQILHLARSGLQLAQARGAGRNALDRHRELPIAAGTGGWGPRRPGCGRTPSPPSALRRTRPPDAAQSAPQPRVSPPPWSWAAGSEADAVGDLGFRPVRALRVVGRWRACGGRGGPRPQAFRSL